MKQGLRATEPQGAVSPLVLQVAWILHVINLVSTWLSLFSGLPHGPPPTHTHTSTHFICRVRLRCSGVLLLTGMW